MIAAKSYVINQFLHALIFVTDTNKKPRNLLRGLCYIEFVLKLFCSITCPATCIVLLGTKPAFCLYV